MTDAHDLDAAIAAIKRATPEGEPWHAGEFGSIHHPLNATICTILNAVVSGELVRALPSVEVTVKPLEWKADDEDPDCVSADNYDIYHEWHGYQVYFWSVVCGEPHKDLASAQAWVWEHHTARIMAALAVQPAPIPLANWRDPNQWAAAAEYLTSQPAPDVAQVRSAALEDAAKACDRIAGNTADFPRDHRRAAGQCAAMIRALITTPAPSPDVAAVDLAMLRKEHAEWSQAQFGDVSAIGPAKHLAKEALEVAADPTDVVEHADCWMLLWDMQRRAGISDDQLAEAIKTKLAINKGRIWPAPKEGEAREHDRDA